MNDITKLVLEYQKETNERKRDILMVDILEQFDKLTHNLAKNCFYDGYTYDDIKQEFRIILINSLERYNGSVSFATYVHNGCRKHLAKMNYTFERSMRDNKFGKDISIHNKAKGRNGGELGETLESVIPSNRNDIDSMLFRLDFDNIKFTDLQRKAVLCKYYGYPDKEFGVAFPEYSHIKHASAQVHRSVAKKKIAEYFGINY